MYKKIITIITIVFLISSCAKDGEVILFKDINNLNYFPNLRTDDSYYGNENRKVFKLEGTNYTTDLDLQYFPTNQQFNSYGSVDLEDSYLFTQGYSNYYGYTELVSVSVNDDKTLYIKITEKHKDVVLVGSYKYEVNLSPYIFNIIKGEMNLNDTWTSNASIDFNYEKEWGSPTVADETKTVIFNYQVIEKFATKVYWSTTYNNVMTVKVTYEISNVTHTRTYSFAGEIGLVGFSINNNQFSII